MNNRRQFLRTATGLLVGAPAIVRPESLMRIRTPKPELGQALANFIYAESRKESIVRKLLVVLDEPWVTEIARYLKQDSVYASATNEKYKALWS